MVLLRLMESLFMLFGHFIRPEIAFYSTSSLCLMPPSIQIFIIIMFGCSSCSSSYSLLIRPIILRNDLLIFARRHRTKIGFQVPEKHNEIETNFIVSTGGAHTASAQRVFANSSRFAHIMSRCSVVSECTSWCDQWTIKAKRLNAYSCKSYLRFFMLSLDTNIAAVSRPHIRSHNLSIM